MVTGINIYVNNCDLVIGETSTGSCYKSSLRGPFRVHLAISKTSFFFSEPSFIVYISTKHTFLIMKEILLAVKFFLVPATLALNSKWISSCLSHKLLSRTWREREAECGYLLFAQSFSSAPFNLRFYLSNFSGRAFL